ncbi:MAG: hypothetical protein CMJ62_15620 [Planctomycetaceae bacterium]|nr:hypothetical protein [Planctomycetaceae bacterium]
MQHFSGKLCWWVLLLTLCPSLVHHQAVAVERPAQITDLQIGFNGHYKVGYWTPVEFTIQGGDRHHQCRCSVTVPDGDGLPASFEPVDRNKLQIPADQNVTYRTYAKFGRIQGNLVIVCSDDQQELIHKEFTGAQLPAGLPTTSPLVVHVGDWPEIEQSIHATQRRHINVANLESVDSLPDHWWGYEGVDSLIITCGDPGIIAALNPVQVDALQKWIQMGGKLIFSVGRHAEQLLGPGGILRELSPGKFLRTVDQCQTIGLENFTDVSHQLNVGRDELGRCELDLALIQQPAGTIELAEREGFESRPVLIRQNYGLGEVVFVAIDLNQSPIKHWKGRERLLARLLEWTLGSETEQAFSASIGAVKHTGYDDLSGQLRSALDQFQNIVFVPYWVVVVLVLLYLSLIGPVDYFLLRRFAKRMEWTWLTLPLIVTAFCVIPYVLAKHLKGKHFQMNQVEIVDIDIDSRFVRGTTWVHAYSPATSNYDFSTQTQIHCQSNPLDQHTALISWQGLPGTALGSMNAASPPAGPSHPYSICFPDNHSSSSPQITEMPLQVWSTKSLTARWWGEIDLHFMADLRSQGDKQLRGSILNPLDDDLTECYLYYAPWAYQIGRIAANRTIPITSSSVRRNLRYKLTRRTLSEENNVMAPWDEYGQNIPRIVEMMMFHEAAGGESYTGMFNRFQTFIDLSRHITSGRAVLVGRTSQPASSFQCDRESGSNQHWTFFRFVLPVSHTKPVGQAGHLQIDTEVAGSNIP